jgi:16S rRNA G966 N2-methylase RsmD
MEGAVVLGIFVGTGALGLEALSLGAASASFIRPEAYCFQFGVSFMEASHPVVG